MIMFCVIMSYVVVPSMVMATTSMYMTLVRVFMLMTLPTPTCSKESCCTKESECG